MSATFAAHVDNLSAIFHMLMDRRNDGPGVVRHGFYPLCLNREAEPEFAHADQMSFAFRLVLGIGQEPSRVYSAIRPVFTCRL
jgi:hypothetical protein